MVTKEIVEEALKEGLPSLKELFSSLPKEDALKGLGILLILGVSKYAIDAIRDIVMNKA